jgi:SH3 domain protein
VKNYLLCGVLLVLSLASWGSLAQETRWLSDQLELDLRSGNSNRYRVIKMLPPGTKVTVLKVDNKAGFSQIKTSDGQRGWVNNTYLMSEPSAREQLTEAKDQIARLTSDNQPLRAQLAQLEEKAATLSAQLEAANGAKNQFEQDLNRVTEVSANAISLDRSNKSLMESNQLLQHEIDVLKGENDRLEDGSDREWFANGVFAVGFGVLLALVIPRIAPKRKHTEWR